MTVAQRIYWLTAGRIVSPNDYLVQVENYVSVNERHARYLADAVALLFIRPITESQNLSASMLKLRVRLIGFLYRPSFSVDGPQLKLNVADCLQFIINQLSSLASHEATLALYELSSNKNLLPWQPQIKDAYERQIFFHS